MASVPARSMPPAAAAVGRDVPSSGKGRALPALGDIVAGKYRLLRQIGEGGMGVVFEAIHERLHQRLAVKILRPDVHDFEHVLARFEREARASAQLRSIHAARVIDVDTLPGGLPYIVLEFLEGQDLEVELRENGPLLTGVAVDITLQVAEVMQEAHTLGITHRDIKPSNLFVCRVGGRRVIKILDFGISSTEDDKAKQGTEPYLGTPYYAAPEQLLDTEKADTRSDVWSLAIVLFELLTGRVPFEGAPLEAIAKVLADPVPWPLDIRPDIPRDLARVLMHALQRDPSERFQTMQEFAEALAPFGPAQSAASAVADANKGRGRLGEILVADGLLSRADLDRALAEHRSSGKLLGQVLLDMKFVAQADLLAALAKQQGIDLPGTPRTPPRRASPVERERHAREARTISPTLRKSAWSSRRSAWISVAIGLPLGIALAVGAATILRKRHDGASHPPLPPMHASPAAHGSPAVESHHR